MLQPVPYSKRSSKLTLIRVASSQPHASRENSATPLLFYVHGGGFVTASSYLIPPHLIGLAQRLNADLISVDYGLCPNSGIKSGVEDVLEAWSFVMGGGVGQGSGTYRPEHTIVIGLSAGSFYSLQLLISEGQANRQVAGFLNIYGATSVDAERYMQPMPQIPHPRLDQPGGFPPLNALVEQLFAPEESSDGSSGTRMRRRPNLPLCPGTPFSLLTEHLASGAMTSESSWRDFCRSNGIDDKLFADLKYGEHTTDQDRGRSDLLVWGFKTGNMLEMLRGDDQTMDELIHYVRVFERMPDIKAELPPVLSVHGTGDVLVPVERSKRFHQVLQERGVPNDLLLVEGKAHGFDTWEWVAGQGADVQRVESWCRERLHLS